MAGGMRGGWWSRANLKRQWQIERHGRKRTSFFREWHAVNTAARGRGLSLRIRAPPALTYYLTAIATPLAAMASARAEPLSIESLLQKQKEEKEAAAKVRASAIEAPT